MPISCLCGTFDERLFAQDAELPPPHPVPAMQVVPQPYDQDSFTRDGHEIVRYHRGPELPRTFLFPVIGPAGRSLTRMGHPQDPVGHSHHNSVWISHSDVNGVNFWSHSGTGRIVHERLEKYTDADEAASLLATNAWKNVDGDVVLRARRRVTVAPLDRDEWQMTIDLELWTDKSPATFAKTSFGLLGVRMAKTIGVHDGGGRITNSEGAVNEKAVFWQPARWCDYSGPIAPGASEGIAMLDHPVNPNHPTKFHVRDDGWMGACLSFDGPLTLEAGKPLLLRYALYVHRDVAPTENIEARWKAFAATEMPTTLALPNKK